MPRLSRVAKYEELRNKLQNDTESEIRSNDLSDYANKLNRIDSNSFKPMEKTENVSYDPIRSRREEYLNTNSVQRINAPSSNQNSNFNNEYLDEIISEVKQYNKEKGLITSDDTSVNILSGLYGNNTKEQIPTTPFPKEEVSYSKDIYTSEIPFMQNANINNPFSHLSDDDLEKTRNDIALEVKNLINEKPAYTISDNSYELKKEIEIKYDKLAQETDKLKLQLDEYEDSLEEADDMAEDNNRILNIVLILIVVILIIVLIFIIYYILLRKGIIQ